MPGSVDTGAREPQICRCPPDFSTGGDSTWCERCEKPKGLAAAGVGVPPPENQDLVGAPARERQDARVVALDPQLTARLSQAYGVRVTADQSELQLRVLKIAEEIGEATEALIGVGGWNPRKGVSHTVEDLETELADVVITAWMALASVSLEPDAVIDHRLEFVVDRMEQDAELKIPCSSAGVGEARPAEPPPDLVSADKSARVVHNGVPDDYWRKMPCGHPPDPLAALTADGHWVCHCGWALDPDDAISSGHAEGAPGRIVPCGRCGCYPALDESEAPASGASAPLAAQPKEPCESCGRLREQLDAARTKLSVAEAYIPSRDFGDYQGDARAALGVVDAPAESVSAPRKEREDAREGQA